MCCSTSGFMIALRNHRALSPLQVSLACVRIESARKSRTLVARLTLPKACAWSVLRWRRYRMPAPEEPPV